MLDLRQLTYLIAVDRRRSFARAAEDLGMSQSALSRAIQALESRLGVRLFDRDRAGVLPTEQGREVVAMAADLLAASGDLERQVNLMRAGGTGRIRFGLAPLPAHALLPAILAERIATLPDLANDVVVRNVNALWPLLLGGEIEFFVSAEGQVPESHAIRAESLGAFPITQVVRPGHPLLSGQDDGKPYPVLLSSSTGLMAPSTMQPAETGTAHIIEDFNTLVAATQGTDAIWRTSAYAVWRELAAGTLCALPHAGGDAPRRMRMMIYSLARRSISPAARGLRDAFEKAVTALAAQAGDPA
ncbi:LysR family transcriptional regulator [Novosphingobium album (ex Hu et al. 2023)]|uniref:LysR family transcriptional regulator n=1 Tax=Novosphingobium album (ex Hu et al. 2023) TaxID=2930093 RepID=A0ABT0B3H8_9SPHN|nr:LysR family transcriptional regulator [Novosphingobium album (ex Hu et al. 2023)]MCJ2179588.1 LysR family transcriptional regulator [Novosphingobium album (ex Hu et al. 2023)]